MARSVQAEDLEAQFARLRTEVAEPAAGVFGPDSLTWRVDREAALFLGAGRALLLQLAHPWVAAAIAEHSRTLDDPLGRFHRTFETMFTLAFGSLDQAFGAARRLHRVHGAISGELPAAVGPFPEGARYRANDAAALQWVYATLVETALLAHDLVLTPLTPEERERYYAESRLMGAMFGLAPDSLPPDWAAFARYNESMWTSDVLTVSSTAREIARQVLAGAGTFLRAPAWYRNLTAHLLPEPLRIGFGFAHGTRERRRAERALAHIRRIYPRLPMRLRTVGPYQEATARLAGAGPDLTTRGLNRLWIGRPSMPGP